MTTTTQLGGLARYSHSATLEDMVGDYLNEFADEFDVAGLVHAFRAAINAELEGWGISMHGDEFYGEVPVPDRYDEAIPAAIAAADLDILAPQYELQADVPVAERGVRPGVKAAMVVLGLIVLMVLTLLVVFGVGLGVPTGS